VRSSNFCQWRIFFFIKSIEKKFSHQVSTEDFCVFITSYAQYLLFFYDKKEEKWIESKKGYMTPVSV